MVLNYSCDQLHRVAASRILSLMINVTKVQNFSETTKLFLNFFRKKSTQNEGLARRPEGESQPSLLCTFERLVGVQGASRWSPRTVGLLTAERLGAMQGVSLYLSSTFRYSPCSPRVVDDGPARAIPLSVVGRGARQGHPCQATFRI